MAAEGSAPARPVGGYAVRLGTLTSLLAGRGAYRLAQLAATVLLLPVWGERYNVYAAAVATFSWLTAFVFTGPEKTALKLLPRSPRTAPLIVEALLALVWLLPVPLLVAYAVVLLRGTGGPAPVYVGVAALQLSTGCTLLLVGLHRAAGRPGVDARTFLTMSAVQVGVLVLAAGGHLLPAGYVAVLVAVQTALNAGLAATLGRPSLRLRHRPRFAARLAATVVLMGGGDVCLYLSTGVLFAILAASPARAEVGRLFVVWVIWSAGVNLLIYLLRVYAPLVSLRQAGAAGGRGRRRAAGLARIAAAYNVVWLLVVAATVGTATAGPPLWTVLLISRAPALLALVSAGYVLENTDARATRVTGLAAALGLATAAGAGLALVPHLGGVGVIVAFAVADTVAALGLALGAPGWTRRRSGADVVWTDERSDEGAESRREDDVR